VRHIVLFGPRKLRQRRSEVRRYKGKPESTAARSQKRDRPLHLQSQKQRRRRQLRRVGPVEILASWGAASSAPTNSTATAKLQIQRQSCDLESHPKTNSCPVPESGTSRYIGKVKSDVKSTGNVRGKFNDARLKRKSRRPLQIQVQIQRQWSRREAGATNRGRGQKKLPKGLSFGRYAYAHKTNLGSAERFCRRFARCLQPSAPTRLA